MRRLRSAAEIAQWVSSILGHFIDSSRTLNPFLLLEREKKHYNRAFILRVDLIIRLFLASTYSRNSCLMTTLTRLFPCLIYPATYM